MNKSIIVLLSLILCLHCYPKPIYRPDIDPTANPLPAIGPFACYINIPPPNILDVTGETSSCGGLVTVTFVSDGSNPGCSGTVVRTYRLTDACGNSANINQNIAILDNVAPTANPLPALGPYACNANIPTANILDVVGEVDNCGGAVTVTFISDGANPGCSGTVVRTYRLTDVCGNSMNITQNITIHNSGGLVITCPANVDINCESSTLPIVTGTAIAMSNCITSPIFTYNDIYTPGSCASNYGINRQWTATDICGNLSTCVQSIIVYDFTAPVITCPPDVTINCEDPSVPANTGTATATDNCDASPVITYADITTPGTNECNYVITRTWTATDNCGNAAASIQTLSINSQQAITVLYPNGSEILYKENEYTINWNSQYISGSIQIDLYKGDVNVLQLAANAPNTGNYPFNPPAWLTDGNNYKIGISAMNGSVYDFSDNNFTITTPQTSSVTNVQVIPSTDGTGKVDVYFNLNGTGSVYYISLEASFNAGSTYTPIAPNSISGDVGPISQGTNKHLTWNGLQSSPNIYSIQTRLKLIASTYPGSVTDVDGNVYQTVLIGSQLWMKENLKTTKYRNGINIEYPGSNWANWTNNTTGAYAWYNDDISWKASYGALYNWYAASNTNGLCPTGWHVPTDAEWTQLTSYISGGTATGGKQLKSCRRVNSPLGGGCNTSVHPRWNFYNTFNDVYGTDDYGFSALPGGKRCDYGSYSDVGGAGTWWSTTVHYIYYAWSREMGSSYSGVGSYDGSKFDGLSVRCVRDY